MKKKKPRLRVVDDGYGPYGKVLEGGDIFKGGMAECGHWCANHAEKCCQCYNDGFRCDICDVRAEILSQCDE